MRLSAQTPQKRLKLLMVDREIEQKKLAALTGISVSLLEKILAGNRRPTQRAIARLEVFFGQPVFSTPERKPHRASLTVRAGDEIEFVTVEQAQAAHPEVADHAVLDGKILRDVHHFFSENRSLTTTHKIPS